MSFPKIFAGLLPLMLMAVMVGIGLVGCTSSGEHLAAEESYSALCAGGARAVSPEVDARCGDLPSQMQNTFFFGEPWDQIRQTSYAAGVACSGFQVNTSACAILARQVGQLPTEATENAFIPVEPLSVADAEELFREACGQGQSDASQEARDACSNMSTTLVSAASPSLSIRDALSHLSGFSADFRQAVQLVSDACWPQGAPAPLSLDSCRSLDWAWVGDDKSRCLPYFTLFQVLTLPERQQDEMDMRNMRQPPICF